MKNKILGILGICLILSMTLVMACGNIDTPEPTEQKTEAENGYVDESPFGPEGRYKLEEPNKLGPFSESVNKK